MNLLVTGILAQLASYPQPLLRAFLLSTDSRPTSVRTLYQVTSGVLPVCSDRSTAHWFSSAGPADAATADRELHGSQTGLRLAGHSGLEVPAGQRPRQQVQRSARRQLTPTDQNSVCRNDQEINDNFIYRAADKVKVLPCELQRMKCRYSQSLGATESFYKSFYKKQRIRIMLNKV